MAEYADLERRLADPAVHADQAAARSLGRRYAQLGPVVAAYAAWKQVGDDLGAAPELGADDESFADEVEQLTAEREVLEERLTLLLVRATRTTTRT